MPYAWFPPFPSRIIPTAVRAGVTRIADALADATLRARHALPPPVALRGGVQRPSERFEGRLEQVVGVAAAELRHVERTARALHQCDEKVGHERRVEGADDAGLRREVVREVRSPTE